METSRITVKSPNKKDSIQNSLSRGGLSNIPTFTCVNGDPDEQNSHDHLALSIVIPINNEQENIKRLYVELIAVLNRLSEDYEIIFVDDGSTDESALELIEISRNNDKIKVIQFSRQFGQTAALSAGFKYAKGDIIITLDADLQNDPADIPMLLEKMADGYDLVNGWRKNRKDTFLTRKVPSIIANRIINRLIYGTGVQLNDYGCTLKAYKRGIVKNLNLYGEMHRFIPVFAAWLGAKIVEIPVNHRPRIYGVPKYNLSRVTRVILDLIVVRFFSDYLTRPIQFFGKIAKNLILFMISLITLLLGLKNLTDIPISYNSIILLGGIIFFSALQFISIGLLGEILIRTYYDNKKNDTYVIKQIVNGDKYQ
jgi:glycosyltransferase involved in cell wall biosynthesis